MKKIWLIIIALGLTACAAPVTREDIARANFGFEPPDTVSTRAIQRYLQNTLIDPESLRLRCTDARKGWARQNILDRPSFGYVVLCGVNAKNRLGGYTGEEDYVFLIHNEVITIVTNKTMAGASMPDSKIQRGDEYDYVE